MEIEVLQLEGVADVIKVRAVVTSSEVWLVVGSKNTDIFETTELKYSLMVINWDGK